MPRKGTLFIVGVSLCFVLIITLTFMLTNTNWIGHQDSKAKMLSEVPVVEKSKQEKPNIGENKNNTNSTNEVHNSMVDGNEKQPENIDSKITIIEPKQVREDKHLNKETANTNILCLGIADKKLEMISIYSINKENKKSAGIFLPTRTSLKVNGKLLSLKEIYDEYGVINLKNILNQCMGIDILYHMVVDNQGLVELSELIGPLYVENENIDIPNLFARPVSDKDDAILQALAAEITKPKMILQVPSLIKIFIKNVKSDIGVSGLWDLYKVFSNLDHSELSKNILWGEKVEMANKEYWFIEPYDWHNVVYEMTY